MLSYQDIKFSKKLILQCITKQRRMNQKYTSRKRIANLCSFIFIFRKLILVISFKIKNKKYEHWFSTKTSYLYEEAIIT